MQYVQDSAPNTSQKAKLLAACHPESASIVIGLPCIGKLIRLWKSYNGSMAGGLNGVGAVKGVVWKRHFEEVSLDWLA